MTDRRPDPDPPGQPDGEPSALPQRPSTMIEVALAAGVSQTTVSLVLNEVAGARFSADTRRRVLEAAERLSYQPARRSLRNTPQGMIAFVVDEIATDPWMALAMDGIRDKAWERGIAVWSATTGGKSDVEQTILRQIESDRVVGLIYGTINTRRIAPLELPRSLPTVLLNCYLTDHSVTSVVPAEVVGGLMATQRLINAGHRRIAYINGEPWMDASRDRLKGFRRAMASSDLPVDPELVRTGNWEPAAGYEQTLELLALATPPTAIFCGNDMMALGCYRALGERGLSVPRDMAVIGYDDREIARHLHPPLTTVLLPHYEIGVEAAEQLFDLIANPNQAPALLKVEGRLIERSSV